MTGELHRGQLHSQADSQEGNAVFAGIADGFDFSFHAALAEAPRHKNAVHPFQQGFTAIFFDVLRIDVVQHDAAVIGGAPVSQGFVEAFVRFLEIDVLADNGDARVMERLLEGVDQLFPGFEDGRAGPHIEQVQDFVVQTLPVVEQRYLIDAVNIDGRDDTVRVDITEMSDLAFDVGRERMGGATQEDIRLNTNAPELLDTVLGGFGLELTRGFHIRHQRKVYVRHMLPADIAPKLADGFQEGQALDIADRSADLDDDDIDVRSDASDAGLDFIGDVRDYLNGAAEIIPTAFLGNDRIVNAA